MYSSIESEQVDSKTSVLLCDTQEYECLSVDRLFFTRHSSNKRLANDERELEYPMTPNKTKEMSQS